MAWPGPFLRQHFLYFFPLPQGQGWLRPTLGLGAVEGSLFRP